MRAQGAKLIEFGDDFQESREYAARLAEEQELNMVQPYHRDFVKGVASYWVELSRPFQISTWCMCRLEWAPVFAPGALRVTAWD